MLKYIFIIVFSFHVISEQMCEVLPEQHKYIILMGRNKKLMSEAHKEVTVKNIDKCLQICLYDDLCLSFNVFKLLNNLGFECSYMNILGSLSQNLIPSTGFNYYEVNQCYPCSVNQDNNGQFCDCREIGIERDCVEWLSKGYKVTGLYKVDVSSKHIDVYCDMNTNGGGWIKFQNRFNGSESFYRNWNVYRDGFGDLTGQFWLGNELIHELTSSVDHELRVDVTQFDGKTHFAQYSSFQLGSEAQLYSLRFNQCIQGMCTGHLNEHNGVSFSTYDKDNDGNLGNCAFQYKGGWWFTNCFQDNLNGVWRPIPNPVATYGIHFFDGEIISYEKSSMMLRRTGL